MSLLEYFDLSKRAQRGASECAQAEIERQKKIVELRERKGEGKREK